MRPELATIILNIVAMIVHGHSLPCLHHNRHVDTSFKAEFTFEFRRREKFFLIMSMEKNLGQLLETTRKLIGQFCSYSKTANRFRFPLLENC